MLFAQPAFGAAATVQAMSLVAMMPSASRTSAGGWDWPAATVQPGHQVGGRVAGQGDDRDAILAPRPDAVQHVRKAAPQLVVRGDLGVLHQASDHHPLPGLHVHPEPDQEPGVRRDQVVQRLLHQPSSPLSSTSQPAAVPQVLVRRIVPRRAAGRTLWRPAGGPVAPGLSRRRRRTSPSLTRSRPVLVRSLGASADELLATVDVDRGACDSGVGHEVDGKGRDILRLDDPPDGQGGAQLLAALVDVVPQQRC
jgi:hypothetical protein